MKERPIIFNDAMVRTILEGRKTQTRRVVKPQPSLETDSWSSCKSAWMASGPSPETGGTRQTWGWSPCPFGETGDRLWVRECFTIESCRGLDYYDPPHADGRPTDWFDDFDEKWWRQAHYRATDPEPELWYDDMDEPGCRWKPSIHMPRQWSRITLEITGVRVERLQDISEDDACAEGVESKIVLPVLPRFAELWQSIYGAESWLANPWVWVVEFRRLECQA